MNANDIKIIKDVTLGFDPSKSYMKFGDCSWQSYWIETFWAIGRSMVDQEYMNLANQIKWHL